MKFQHTCAMSVMIHDYLGYTWTGVSQGSGKNLNTEDASDLTQNTQVLQSDFPWK